VPDKATADYCEALLGDHTYSVDFVAFKRVKRPGEHSDGDGHPDAVPSLRKFIEEAIEGDPENRKLRECRELILRSESETGDATGAVQ
jgi:hypothetical protein